MNKINIDGIIVVEGKEDVSYLSSFINALFFTTNGLDISNDKLDFLSRAAKQNKIIVLTDNDKAGDIIRNKIKSQINGVFEAKIKGFARKNYKKHGVAESNKEEIVEILKPFVSDPPIKKTNYDLVTLISLSNDPNSKRNEICDKYRLIYGDNKSLENQLNMLKISKEELWK